MWTSARPAAKSIGLPALGVHDLRHTAASLAVGSGANVKAVQQMVGHASAAMTLDVYAGLFADDLDSVADRLDAAARQADADFSRTTDAPDGLDGQGQTAESDEGDDDDGPDGVPAPGIVTRTKNRFGCQRAPLLSWLVPPG